MTLTRFVALGVIGVVIAGILGYQLFARQASTPSLVSNLTVSDEAFDYALEMPGTWETSVSADVATRGALHQRIFRPIENDEDARVELLLFAEPTDEFEIAVSQPGSVFGTLGLHRYVLLNSGLETQLGFELIATSLRHEAVETQE